MDWKRITWLIIRITNECIQDIGSRGPKRIYTCVDWSCALHAISWGTGWPQPQPQFARTVETTVEWLNNAETIGRMALDKGLKPCSTPYLSMIRFPLPSNLNMHATTTHLSAALLVSIVSAAGGKICVYDDTEQLKG